MTWYEDEKNTCNKLNEKFKLNKSRQQIFPCQVYGAYKITT